MIRKTNLANKSNYGGKRSLSSIKYIVVHYTANDGDSDEGNGNYFKGANRNASAHVFVDDDSCTQSVPDDYVAWSVGGNKYPNTNGGKFYGKATNANTLNLEMCDSKKNGVYEATPQTQENAITIIREWMKKYNIPIDRVIRHYDVTGKQCPAYFVDEKKWAEFKNKIINGKKKEDAEMKCLFKIDGNATVYYFDGNRIVALTNSDQMKILQEIYKDNNGHDMPFYSWTHDAPWYMRLKQVIDLKPVTKLP